MTLKELIMKVDFDRIRPYLEDFEAEHLDSIYAYREAYDTLRDMEPDRESHGRIKISWNGGTENGEGKWLNVSGIHVNWEAALNYDIVIADNVRLPLEELAMHCLWEITFWGFSPEEEFETYKRKHDFPKITNEYEVALMKLRESIWKHQVRRKSSCKKTNDPQHRVLTLPDLPMAPMNGPKQKRAQRQKKRTQRLKGLAARENLIRALTANGSSLHRNDVDFLLNVNCGTQYDYTSATHNISSRLNYILESITKYQHLALDRYNNAIIHIRVSSHYPLSEQEFEKFKTGTRAYLGYEDIIFGTTATDDRTPKIKVTILLNLREEAKKVRRLTSYASYKKETD